MTTENKYSYQDCWNYALSLQENAKIEEVKNDIIALCQTSPENFWIKFSYKLLNFTDYTTICCKLSRYLKENYPVPYLTNQVYFYGLPFYVEKGVFIPQKDTEILVEKTLEYAEQYWKKEERLKVLDLGTGCGNVVLALAKQKPSWNFTAIDKSKKALVVARINAKIGQITNVRFLASDLFAKLTNEEKFNIVVTNPPYVSITEYQDLTSSVKEQPRTALVAKNNGYYFYQKIFRQVGSFLTKKFLLVIEIGYHQAPEIIKLVINYFPHGQFSIYPDYQGQRRVVVIWKD